MVSSFLSFCLSQELRLHCVQSRFSRVRLCNPMDCRLPGPSAHGILQAKILESVAISSFRGYSRPMDQTCISYVSCTGRRVLYHGRHLGSPAAAAAKLLQSCPILCDPIDGSPPGSPIPGILQARTLEWVAISFSNAGKWKVKVKSLSRVRLLATPWTVAYQALPPMGFSRQEYWSGVPLPSPIYILGNQKKKRKLNPKQTLERVSKKTTVEWE